MPENIPILPLSTFEILFHQKCLLPESKLPPASRPGSWAKCIWDLTDNYYSICQIFAKDCSLQYDPFCYLDNIVGSQIFNTSPSYLRDIRLLELIAPVSTLKVLIDLDEEFYFKHFKRFKIDYIQNIVQILLQALHFTKNSCIQTSDLLKWGVSRIHVLDADDVTDNQVFTINDQTKIHFHDIRLARQKSTETMKIIDDAFGSTYEELKDFIKIKTDERASKLKLPANPIVIGPNGCGKSLLIEKLCREFDCNCFDIRIGKILGQYPGDTEKNLRNIFEAAEHFRKVFPTKTLQMIILEDLHILCPANSRNSEEALNSGRITSQLVRLIDGLQKRKSKIICLSSTTSLDKVASLLCRSGRFDQNFSIALPTQSTRVNLLLNIFEYYKTIYKNITITDEIIQYIAKNTHGYVIVDMQLLSRNIIQNLDRIKESAASAMDTVKEVLYNFKPTSMLGIDITVVKPTEGFETIAGMESLKQELKVSVLGALEHKEAFKRFNLDIPKGILLYGPPGCGKTKFAQCLAYEANMTFITTSGAEVYSPYVGQAEKFLTKIFDTARRHAPCLIFFDEIDTLVGKRTIGGGQGSVQMRILSTMLTEMDGIQYTKSYAVSASNTNEIMVVAATNRPDMLDDALIRPGRFNRLIHVPPPDFESRRQLLLMQAKNSVYSSDVDIDELAHRTANSSGADIKNLCNEAALFALQTNINANEVTSQDFNAVLQHFKPSLTPSQITQYETLMQKEVLS